jgi:hypothetical protein
MMILAYGVFGWIMFTFLGSPWSPIVGAACIVILMIALTLPLQSCQAWLDHWLQSKLRAIITLLLAAFAVVLVVSWLHISIHILVLLAAALLVRIELIGQGVTKGKIFLILIFFALGSYSLGVFTRRQFLAPKTVESSVTKD